MSPNSQEMGDNQEKIYREEAVIPPLDTMSPNKINLPPNKIIDWPRIFEENKRRLGEEIQERKRKLDKKENLERSWQLAKVCREYIRENSKKWAGEVEERRKKREKELAKEERKHLAREKREDTLKKLTQKKITNSLKNLSEEDRKKVLEIEDKKRTL